MHWARRYVGKPWAADGDGPARFSCWGLVRDIVRTQEGVELPAIAVAEPSEANVMSIMRAARVSGRRPVLEGRPQARDIVLMRGLGRLHVGYVIEDRGRVKVLHSAHERGVACDFWEEATLGMTVELWRAA